MPGRMPRIRGPESQNRGITLPSQIAMTVIAIPFPFGGGFVRWRNGIYRGPQGFAHYIIVPIGCLEFIDLQEGFFLKCIAQLIVGSGKGTRADLPLLVLIQAAF
jgi:hypothetical protein